MKNSDRHEAGEPVFTRIGLAKLAADYFSTTQLPREQWKTLEDLRPQLDEFDLRCESGDWDTAARVLHEIDFDYLLLWGYSRMLVELHGRLQGRLTNKRLMSRSANGLANSYEALGHYREAITAHEQALAIDREAKDRLNEGADLGNLGLCYSNLGQTAKAIDYHEQALTISREVGDRAGEGATLGNLGLCYSNLGQTANAIEYHEQALAIFREVGNRAGEAVTLGNLGLCYSNFGQYTKAIEVHEQALTIKREVGNRLEEGTTLGNLGSCYDSLGQYTKAIEYHEQALAISRQVGNRDGAFYRLDDLARCHALLGQYEAAADYGQQGLELAAESEAPSALPRASRRLGYMALLRADWTAAAAHYQACQTLADERGIDWLQHQSRRQLAQVALFTGRLAEARQFIDAALHFEQPTYVYMANTILGAIALRQGDMDAAARAFRTVITHTDELIGHSDQNYDAWDARFIALAGLALLATDPAERESHLVDARAAYAKARSITDAPGVVTDVRQLLDALKLADTDGVLGDL